MNGLSKWQINELIKRIENLNSQKAEISEDIKAVYDEAKQLGYDTKALRELIKIRKQDRHEWRALMETVSGYATTAGEPLPLFEALSHPQNSPTLHVVAGNE